MLFSKNILLFLLCLAFSPSTFANETIDDKLQFSGFATLGAVTSSSDLYGYRKTIGSDEGVFSGEVDFKQHSLVGLQIDGSILPSVDFVYQGVLRDLPDPSFDRYTTLAFLRYEINSNWSVRAGRTAPDVFLLTEYRDVDFAYGWATAPNEVYGIIPYRSIDGIDVTYSQRGFDGVFKTKLFTGSSETEIASYSVVEEFEIKNLVGISLSYDHFDWIIHAKHTQGNIGNESNSNLALVEGIGQVPDYLWPNSQDYAKRLLIADDKVLYSSLSGQYQWNNWLASIELSRINPESSVIPNVNGGYGALSYQFNTHQFYGVYAFTSADIYVFDELGVNKPVLEDLISGATGTINFYSANQHTLSLGWRWDITSYLASSLQWNYTQVEEGGATLWVKKPADFYPEEDINTFFLTLSLVF